MRTLLGELLNKAPVPIPGPSGRGGGGLFAPSRSTATDALEMFGQIGPLFNVIDTTANAVSAIDWHLMRAPTSTAASAEPVEVLRHPAVDLWNNPNDHMHGVLFREASQQYFDLVGEAIWLVVRAIDGNGRRRSPIPLELWLIRPDKMTPAVRDSAITGWIYHGPRGEKIPLDADQVIFTFRPNPCNPWRGIGAASTILNELDAYKYAVEFNKRFFANSAEPGGVIQVDGTLSDPEFDRLNAQWRERHQGVSNAHRVAILEGGAKWQDRSVSHRDMQFVELRKLMVETIRETYGFQKVMSGATEDVNRANGQAGKESFAEDTVGPALQRWKGTLNHRLLPMFPDSDRLTFDHDSPVPEDREDERAELDAKTKAAATLRDAGWDPDDVLETVGLPPMRYTGPAQRSPTPAA